MRLAYMQVLSSAKTSLPLPKNKLCMFSYYIVYSFGPNHFRNLNESLANKFTIQQNRRLCSIDCVEHYILVRRMRIKTSQGVSAKRICNANIFHVNKNFSTDLWTAFKLNLTRENTRKMNVSPKLVNSQQQKKMLQNETRSRAFICKGHN